MSSVERVLGPDGRPRAYTARWRDPSGVSRQRTFTRKSDADRLLAVVDGDKVRGAYVDPTNPTTVRQYAEEWRATKLHRPTTADYYAAMLRLHVYPVLGDRRMASVRPSEIQGWVKGMSRTLKPSTIGTIHGILAGVFKAAVRDRLIAGNPLEGTRLPRAHRPEVIPLTVEQVQTLADTVPERFRALVVLSATTGLRQGECLGLTVDRLDLMRGTLRVDRQLVLAREVGVYLGPPKTEASTRTVPLAAETVTELVRHLRAFPTAPQSVRVADAAGQPSDRLDEVELIFTGGRGAPIRRNGFGPDTFAPAVVAAELPEGTGFHALRHFYASLLIAHGESIKVVQARLGHATAAETLDTYAHLFPDTEDGTRDAISAAFRPVSCGPVVGLSS